MCRPPVRAAKIRGVRRVNMTINTSEEALQIAGSPEKIIDPAKANFLAAFLGGLISDKEEELNERNYQVSVRWGKLRESFKTNAEADRRIELESVYLEREKVKLFIGKLRRLRGDIKDRFAVLTNIKRY